MPVWNTGRRGRRVMGDIEGGKVVKGSILFMRTETELQTCLWYSCLQTQLNEKTQISEAKSCLWRKNWEADSVTHCPFLPTPKVSLEIWCCSAFCKNEFFFTTFKHSGLQSCSQCSCFWHSKIQHWSYPQCDLPSTIVPSFQPIPSQAKIILHILYVHL